jgi:hypothetical protein
MRPSWNTHLEIIASRKGIEGAAKEALMETFSPCDPNCGASKKPCIPHESNPGYSAYYKAIGKAYRKLGFGKKEPDKAEKDILPWLIEEYESPKIATWESIEPDRHVVRLDEHLRELNYGDQREQMRKAIRGAEIAKVILVSANGNFTQRWLVKRLSLEAPNHSLSKGFSILAKPNWDKGLKHFWLGLSQYTDGAETPEEIIQVLCDQCRSQPLIMAIYGIQAIKPATLQTLLSDFWGELVESLSKQPWCSDRGDCILFLSTNVGTQHSVGGSYGVPLDPWDFVTVEHMNQWLKPLEVKKLLAECSKQSAKDACLDLVPEGKQPSDSLGPPEEMLTRICTTFDLDSVTELEKYWKIAS